jgi:NAD(P)-dependent dehydrogenase (short-subunit alcohol dehydrogenase family)
MTETKVSMQPFADPHAEDIALDARSLFNVEGKIGIVTGGSRGLGLMMAQGLAANGAKVYVCSRKAEACKQAAAALNDRYGDGRAVSLPGDLSTLEGVEAFVDAFHAREDALHILVNNAGATYGAPFEEYPDDAWEKVMNLNVRHVFNLTRLLQPQLRAGASEEDPGRVVNIASIDGIRALQAAGPTAAFAYTTSKGALVHMTKALCRALSPDHITVNCIAPGVFPSKMTKFMLAQESTRKAIEGRNPLGRNGRTADIAATLLYLASPGGAYTNGAIIPLDGGGHLHRDFI